MADADTINSVINDVSEQAAAWYSVLANRPAPVVGTPPQLTQQQIAAASAAQNPTTTYAISALGDPFFVLGLVAVAIAVIVLIRSS